MDKVNIKIPVELFTTLCKYFLLDEQQNPAAEAYIKAQLQEKLNKAAAHQQYSAELKKRREQRQEQ